MRLVDVTLPTAEENLALDEVLLNQAENSDAGASGDGTEVLRLWEPASPAVVVGSGSRVAEEVNETACHERGIPVLRRISGGAAVVTGPGCLMYSLVLSHERRPRLKAVDLAHRFVLSRMAEALGTLREGVADRGTSDLAVGDRKFSGNSVRVRRNHFLYHGTILYDFPLEVIAVCLRPPPRTPEYRQGRDHRSFVTNFPSPVDALRRCLIRAWHADEPFADWPRSEVAHLSATKYHALEWNFRR